MKRSRAIRNSSFIVTTDSTQFNINYITMKSASQILIYCLGVLFVTAQNVGIGTTTPTEKLEILGNIKGTNFLVTGNLGINTNTPLYRLHLNDGALALTNSTDAATWTLSYNTGFNLLNLAYNNSTRMVFNNTGNVGIGTTSAPAYKLEVAGSLAATSATIDGNLTVNDGHGVLRNGHSSSQLKYYTFTGSFGFTNFAGHTVSGPHQVNFPAAADFTSAPRVMTANYIVLTGTGGHVFSIIPSILGVTSTGFSIYFFNSSTNAATQDFTISFVCIGN